MLENLGLFQNELSGQIPIEICTMSSLSSLSLEGNKLTGPIPPELFTQLRNLTWVSALRSLLAHVVKGSTNHDAAVLSGT